jgi:hypothetical protein
MPWWNICRRFGSAMSRGTRNRNKSAMCFAAVRRMRERVHANTRCGLRPRRFSASLRVAEASASVRTYPSPAAIAPAVCGLVRLPSLFLDSEIDP